MQAARHTHTHAYAHTHNHANAHTNTEILVCAASVISRHLQMLQHLQMHKCSMLLQTGRNTRTDKNNVWVIVQPLIAHEKRLPFSEK